MDELPQRARTVLRHARDQPECPDQETRRRVREGVAKAVGARAFERPNGATSPTLLRAGSAPLSGLLGKLAATTLLFALVGSGIAWRHRAATPREQRIAPGSLAAPRSSPTPELSAAAGMAQRAVTEAAPQVPELADTSEKPREQPPLAPDRPRRRLSAAPSDMLDLEVVLLRQLGEAVSRRDTREASRLLARHRARFPQPVLLEERQAFQALVACMDHSPAALSSARAFAVRNPNSVLTARVLRECEQATVAQ